MTPFDHPDFDDHAQVTFHQDPATGLKAIVAQHRIWAQPSIGGCRMRDYPDDAAALADVLKLSHGMTFKSVMAGCEFGGAKAVIVGVPRDAERAARFRAMGRFVDSFGGRFKTGVDVGLTREDVETMREETPHLGGLGGLAPDMVTARGVYEAIRAGVRHRLGRDEVAGLRVAIQGLGKVGGQLAGLLVADGARVVAGDVSAEAAEAAAGSHGVEIVAPDRVHAQEADVFSPCALGGVLNENTLPELKASVVAGAANNQLATPEIGARLDAADILYTPDYIANSGGLIAVAAELENRPEDWVWRKVAGLADTLGEVFAHAATQRIRTDAAADGLAEARIAAIEAGTRAAA